MLLEIHDNVQRTLGTNVFYKVTLFYRGLYKLFVYFLCLAFVVRLATVFVIIPR